VIVIELALLAFGTFLYWRAATTLPEGGGSRARLVTVLIFAGGLATLALDVTGALGG
jgi:hypothetical protein